MSNPLGHCPTSSQTKKGTARIKPRSAFFLADSPRPLPLLGPRPCRRLTWPLHPLPALAEAPAVGSLIGMSRACRIRRPGAMPTAFAWALFRKLGKCNGPRPETTAMRHVALHHKSGTMQASSILIRWALESELDVLLLCDTYAQTNESRVQELRFALETRSCLIAETSSEAVGFVLLQYSFFGNGFIPLVCVAHHHRGRGFGLQLLLGAEQHCQTAKLFTSTNRSNTTAQRLFTKAGFSPSGTIENLDEGDPELVYFKRLSR